MNCDGVTNIESRLKCKDVAHYPLEFVALSLSVYLNKGFIFTTSSTFKLTLTLLGFTMVFFDNHYKI